MSRSAKAAGNAFSPVVLISLLLVSVVALAGLEDAYIGDTVSDPDHPGALPTVVVDEPTLPDVLRLAARLARALPDRPLRKYREACELELGRGEYTLESFSTEAEAIVRRRVGQQIYRASLMDYWDGRCAVTGIALPELLRASHSKDWAHCASDAERLNVFNGFLLAAHLDALYDRKLMTFDDAGNALYSPRIDPHTRAQLGLNEPLRLSKIDPRHLPFLHWHRFVFENAPEA